MDVDLTDGERRLALTALAASGVAHLLVPGRLLAAARRAYGFALDVSFRPQEGASRRVRLVGVATLALAALATRLADRI